MGVATVYGRPYFAFARSLERLRVRFDSILPTEMLRYTGDLIFTTRAEAQPGCSVPVLYEDVCKVHPAVLRGLMLQRLYPSGHDELIIGVDPGSEMGLCALYHGMEIEGSTYPSAESLVSHIIELLAGLGARRKIVKVGTGSKSVARQIGDLLNLRYCSSFELELVDEHGTSPRIRHQNQRGKRDMLSAKYISQRRGIRHTVLPLSITG